MGGGGGVEDPRAHVQGEGEGRGLRSLVPCVRCVSVTRCFPCCRKVVEYGIYMKHCKVEVYLLDFRLCLHPDFDKVLTKSFSRSDTVGMYTCSLWVCVRVLCVYVHMCCVYVFMCCVGAYTCAVCMCTCAVCVCTCAVWVHVHVLCMFVYMCCVCMCSFAVWVHVHEP